MGMMPFNPSVKKRPAEEDFIGDWIQQRADLRNNAKPPGRNPSSTSVALAMANHTSAVRYSPVHSR